MKKKTYGKRIAAWVLAAIMATSACPETVLLAAPVGEPQEDVEALSEEGEENIQENEEPGEALEAEEPGKTDVEEEDSFALEAAEGEETEPEAAPEEETVPEEENNLEPKSLEAVVLADTGLVADFSWYQADETVFTLSSEEEMRALAEIVANGPSDDGYGAEIDADDFAGKTILLDADMDFTGETWTPIGTQERPFAGTFDGQGHTVTYTVDGMEKSYQGLFAYNSGTLRDFTVAGSMELSKSQYLGGAAAVNNGVIDGVDSQMDFTMDDVHVDSTTDIANRYGCYVGGVAGLNYGTIQNATYNGTLDAGTFIGGIAGWSFGVISDSSNSGKIIVRDLDAIYNTEKGAGGIAGVVTSRAGTEDPALIEGCVNNGEVWGYYHAGGITAFLNSGTVRNCINNGYIQACWNNGGIVGAMTDIERSDRRPLLENCYNTGELDQDSSTASDQGITSSMRSYNYCAGIVGFGKNEDIQNCFNSGYIHGKLQVGGIIGGDYNGMRGTMDSCYNMGEVTGGSYVGGVSGWLGGTAVTNCEDFVDKVSEENAKTITDRLNANVTEENGFYGWNASGTDVFFGIVYGVDFQVTPEDATVKVFNSAEAEVPAAEDGAYSLQSGEYTYEVSKEGYQTETGSFTIGDTGLSLSVELLSVWGEDADTSWYEESQESFVLTEANQLAGLGSLVTAGTDFAGKTISLGADIRLVDKEWAGIGDANLGFAGTFDGASHKITGLAAKDGALFTNIVAGGVVKNLGVSGVGAIAATNAGSIENCYAVTTDTKAAVALDNQGSIRNCVSGSEIPVAADNAGVENSFYINGTYTEESFTDGTIAKLLNQNATATNGWYPWTAGEAGTTLQAAYTAAFTIETKDGGDAEDTVLKIFDSEGTEITEETTVNYKTGENTYRLIPGKYTYTATLSGYADREGSFTIKKADLTRTITMAKRYTLRLTVRDQVASTALANAKVTVKNSSGKSETVTSSSNGIFVYNLLDGDYTYEITCEGYQATSGNTTVSGGSKFLNVRMKKYPTLYFTIAPEDAKEKADIQVKNAGGEKIYPNSDGSYSFIEDGTYNWTVTSEGYWTESKTFEVKEEADKNVEFREALEMSPTYPVKFEFVSDKPQNQTIEVLTEDGETVEPSEDLTYLLKDGTYTYMAKAYGYEIIKKELVIDGKGQNIPIEFEKRGYDVNWYDPDAKVLEINDTADFMAFMAMTVGQGVDENDELIARDTFQNKDIQLNADLVLSELENEAFVPIGSQEAGGWGFEGDFYGNGYSITVNLETDKFANLALFDYVQGYNSATIEGLTVKGKITNTYKGAKTYTAGFTANNWSMSMVDCHNEADITSMNPNSASYTGGLVASTTNYNELENCTNSGTITGKVNVGGVIANASQVSLTGCTNTGTVIGTENVGGVIGTGQTVTDSKNEGEVRGETKVGGIIGYGSNSTVRNCENHGKIEGTDIVGGIAGYLGDGYGTWASRSNVNYGDVTALGRAVGGVAGEYNPSGYNLPAVTGMVNFGTITGSGNAMGGIFGLMDDSNNATDIKVENCYSVGQLLLVGTGTTVGNICGEVPTGKELLNNNFYSSESLFPGCGNSEGGTEAVEPSAFTDGTIQTQMNLNVRVANQAQVWETGEDNYPYPTGDEAALTFDVSPDYANITLKNPDGEVLEPIIEGSKSYAGLTKNTYYEYTATSTSTDYQNATGTIIYKGTALTEEVTLPGKSYTITFAVIPAYAKLVVKDSEGNEMNPSSAKQYKLTPGEYSYLAMADNYQTTTGTFTVGGDSESRSRTITVQMEKGTKVTFSTNANLPEYQKFTVYDSADQVIETRKSGIYYLAPGEYRYKVEAEGYLTKEGEDCVFTVGEEALEISVELTMEYDVSWYNQAENLYEISNEMQLKGLSEIVSGTSANISQDSMQDKTIRLIQDIELTSEQWQPIGAKNSNNTKRFAGTFDGCGHTISGIHQTDMKTIGGYAGFFIGLDATGTICNLTLEGQINSEEFYNAGAFVAHTGYGTILNCVNKCEVTARNAAGFINSANNGTTIENCRNEGMITSTSGWAGGLAGQFTGQIINSANTGMVYAAGSYAGGLIGYMNASGTNEYKIENSYNAGEISTSGQNGVAGGIAGYVYANDNKVTVENCYNTGKVYASDGVGSVAAITGNSSGKKTLKSCYYLEGSADYSYIYAQNYMQQEGFGSLVGIAEEKAEEAFSDGTVATALNKGATLTNGYDRWVVKEGQTVFSNGKDLIFSLNPVDAKLTLKDASGKVVEQAGVNSYTGLKAGEEYTYTVEKEGLTTEIGTVVAQENPLAVDVNLSATILLTISKDGTFFKSEDGETPMVQVPITVNAFDVTAYGYSEVYNSDEGPTLLNAFIRAHELYSEEGADGFYATPNNDPAVGNDLFVREFWNIETTQLNYWVNNKYPGEWLEDEGYIWGSTADNILVKNEDDVEVDLYADYTVPMYHSFFDQTEATVKAGEELKLNLKGFVSANAYEHKEPPTFAMEGSEIYADLLNAKTDLPSESTGLKTDKDGNVTLTFKEPGTYLVSAKGTETKLDGEKAIITAPYCIVTVEESEVDLEVQAVIEKINAIGEVTLESEKAIQEAREAYDALSEDQKKEVTNYEKLAEAEKNLEALKQEEQRKAYEAFISGKPEVKTEAVSYDSIRITWEPYANAKSYYVYRKVKGESFKRIAWVQDLTDLSYTDETAVTGTTYYYTVKAASKKWGEPVYSKYVTDLSAKATLAKASISKTQTWGYNGIKVTWDEVDGADGYRLYYKIDDSGWRYATQTEDTSYVHTGVTTGKVYTYYVRAYRNIDGAKVYGAYSDGKSGKAVPKKAVIAKATAGDGKVTLNWNKVNGASGYRIYYKTSEDGEWHYVTQIGKGSTTSYTNTGLKSGHTYYYTMRAYRTVDGEKVFGSYSDWVNVTVK
ncbi:carboxypeptidase regulatory-like domain-containing protein [Blautia hydrogenotrophica]|uniref:carboxypeptidase regulatory-like domain-containing protein n=1 Tax=Blautia hydrogenotrophica TaxID=53443 RepID=UPI0023F0D8A5|nr:carboxypeptidase regulatory-like domain-containing protein [Blautia hydrogenotrophica]